MFLSRDHHPFEGTNALILPLDIARRTRTALRSARGAFDLPSIITAVVVVGVLTAGVLAAIFGVIPFAQDNGAKQDLAAVRTAEGVARTKNNKFLAAAPIVAAGYLPNLPRTTAVGTNDAGSCYVGLAKSGSGTIFYGTDAQTDPRVLERGKDTGCISADALKALVDGVGGFSGVPAPGAPVVSASVATPTRATFSWPAVLDADTYTVDYRINSGPWMSKSAAQKETTVSMDALKGNSLEVRVAATNTAGDSAFGTSSVTLPGSGVENGGFEAGTAGWTTNGIVTNAASHSGGNSARVYKISTGTLSQDIAIPDNGTTTTLSFWHRQETIEPVCGNDYASATIKSSTGAQLKQIYGSNTCTSASSAWIQETADLTPYRGQTVTIYFSQVNSTSNYSYTYIDDVTAASGPATVPSAPVGVTADSGSAGAATVSWPAVNTGGVSVTGYTITPYLNGAAQSPTTVKGDPAPPTAKIENLVDGGSYTFTVAATNSIGTSAPSPASAPVTVNLFSNSSFESGLSGWASDGATASNAASHSGGKSARVYKISTGTLSRDIAVPDNGTTTTLSFWHRQETIEPVCTNDYANATIKSSTGAQLKQIYGSNTCTSASSAWIQETADLTPYRGQTVTIYFSQVNSTSNYSYTYIDDVTVVNK
jgi:DNA-dependent RNA polymerase auxiliary subunit epsilon